MKSSLKKIILDFDPYCILKGDVSFQNLGFDLRNPLPQTCTFCTSIDFLNQCLSNKNISCIITDENIYQEAIKLIYNLDSLGFIIINNPKYFFFTLHNFLIDIGFYTHKRIETYIHTSACVSSLASVAPFNVYIGDNVIVEDFVVIKENVTIGANTRIQSGAIIGNDCLQCINYLDGNEILDVKHVGGVKIGSNVKIESNSLICRHIFNDNTMIGDFTKVGGLCHVSHGCKISERVIITANVFIGGSTIIEDDVFIGPNATVGPMLTIKKGARITLGSVVTKDIGEKMHVTGNFAIPHQKFLENLKKTIQ